MNDNNGNISTNLYAFLVSKKYHKLSIFFISFQYYMMIVITSYSTNVVFFNISKMFGMNLFIYWIFTWDLQYD